MRRMLSAPRLMGKEGGASIRGVAGQVSLGTVVLAAVAALTYVLLLPWISTWGATKEEASMGLPGDQLVPNPSTQSTLAVTIDAPPEKVWPWLVQMGVDRAGFYNYLFVENTLLRLGVRNADRIHPEWQDIEVGDEFRFKPEGYPGPPLPGPEVAVVQKNRALLMCDRVGERCANGTWQFVLSRQKEGATRLLLRSRDGSLDVFDRVLGPGIYVMNRGMLLGIEHNAEGAPSERSLTERISLISVVAAALGLVAMLLPRRRWPQTLIVASVGACLTTLVFFVFYPSVVSGLLLDSAVLGALLWTCWPQRSPWTPERRVA